MKGPIILTFVMIIVVAAILFLVTYFWRKKNQNKLDLLEKRKIDLFDLPVLAEIDEIKKMHLVGQSQNTFRDWNQKWQELSTTDFANFESQVFEAESMNETYRFFKVNESVEKAEATISQMEKSVAEIQNGLKDLKESEAKNSEAIQHALDVYDALEKSIKGEENEAFGLALPELKKQLKNAEKEFATFASLNTSGDPIEAREILEQAEKKTFALEALANRIPPLNTLITTTYPQQMEEIETVYQRLKKENYVFPDQELPAKMKEVHHLLEENSRDLAKIELDSIENKNKEIEFKLDYLYDALEKEMKAKTYIEKSHGSLLDFIRHAKNNNHQLLIELDHTSQTYILTQNEIGRVRGFQAQIDEVTRQYQDLEPKYNSHEIAYSELEQFYRNASGLLEEIEGQQVEIDQSLDQKRADEKVAHEKSDVFEFKLRTLKRYVEQQRLPGLPGAYLDFFFDVTDHVEQLSKELNQPRVNMDEVNELVALCEGEVTSLEQQTDDVIDAAALTEETIQYANRYKTTHPHIKEAIEEALLIFKKDYDYQSSLDKIGRALEVAEPGAFERIEGLYYKNKDENQKNTL